MAHDFPAWKKDGEDLNDHDGETNPLRGHPDLVDRGHLGNVYTDQPHWGGMETSDSAADGLDAPAVGVVNAAGLPENERSDEPGPEELHTQARPPFPSGTLFRQDFHWGSGNLGAGNTPRAVVLAGNEPHQDSKEDLTEHGDGAPEKDFGGILGALETADQAGWGRNGGAVAEVVGVHGELLLLISDVEEASVRAMEEGHAARQQGPHEPIATVSRQDWA